MMIMIYAGFTFSPQPNQAEPHFNMATRGLGPCLGESPTRFHKDVRFEDKSAAMMAHVETAWSCSHGLHSGYHAQHTYSQPHD